MARPAHPSIVRARQIARLMDSAITIPIIRKKIGLDPLLGMLPVGGDVVSALMALYLIYLAYDLRLPNHVLARMGVNVAADILVGLIPVVGDIADMVWKSNDMNLKILEAAYQKHGVGPRRDEQGQVTVDVVAEPA
ncbi:MAG TPA: DUF4112 domain-containing protein [Coleofasciculaceae cyanobacterium]|jgi:hypothetical protein